MDNEIRAGDPRLAQIDVLVLGFLAREGVVQVKLPSYCYPREEAVLREEKVFSRQSLEAEIDQF